MPAGGEGDGANSCWKGGGCWFFAGRRLGDERGLADHQVRTGAELARLDRVRVHVGPVPRLPVPHHERPTRLALERAVRARHERIVDDDVAARVRADDPAPEREIERVHGSGHGAKGDNDSSPAVIVEGLGSVLIEAHWTGPICVT